MKSFLMSANKNALYTIIFMLFFIQGCGTDYVKSPVDDLITKLEKVPKFTIILNDMDAEGTFFKTYKHQYKILKQYDSIPKEEITPWTEVSEEFFWKHENDLGMEIAAKSADGKIVKAVAPPGFSNYVGNPKYGNWVTGAGGTSVWEFFGYYAFMNTIFNMSSYRVGRGWYDDYNNNYRYRKPYYGPMDGGVSKYGTYSKTTYDTKPPTFLDKVAKIKQKGTSFNDRVAKKVTRSGDKNNYNFRSRGGGFGK